MNNQKTPIFLNGYHCPRCGEQWHDEADSLCDDRCPKCNLACSPAGSQFLRYVGRYSGLDIRNRITLSQWLRNRVSLAEVQDAARIGAVQNERFSERTRQWYFLIWKWSAVRISNELNASQDQERYCGRRGFQALKQRMERINKIADRIANG